MITTTKAFAVVIEPVNGRALVFNRLATYEAAAALAARLRSINVPAVARRTALFRPDH